MGAFDIIDEVPRRTMVLFFLIDASDEMYGDKIGGINSAVHEVIPYIKEISDNNSDAQIKIAVMRFGTNVDWMYPQPIPVDKFKWRAVNPHGDCNLGRAFSSLNEKLSLDSGFMKEASGSFAPAIILMSEGSPSDNYKRALQKLQNNNWFKAAVKVAIAVGNNADRRVLADFTGSKKLVLTVHNKEQLKHIIRLVSVTSSQVASRHSSIGYQSASPKISRKNLYEDYEEEGDFDYDEDYECYEEYEDEYDYDYDEEDYDEDYDIYNDAESKQRETEDLLWDSIYNQPELSGIDYGTATPRKKDFWGHVEDIGRRVLNRAKDLFYDFAEGFVDGFISELFR